VAVDGINPTLALAALLFGMSGNPQDTSDSSLIDAQIAERPACESVAHASNPAQLPRGADPIVRQYMPAANTAPATDRCKPER
jgi:hypothetical protein